MTDETDNANNKKLTQQEANALVADYVKQAEELIAQASAIAEEYDLSFNWEGPGYGMGGWFSSGEWQSSSSSC